MPKQITYEELSQRAEDRHVIVLGGFSRDYSLNDLLEIEHFVDQIVRQVKTRDTKVMVVCGATSPGIGKIYNLLRQKIGAADLDKGQIIATGLVADEDNIKSPIDQDCTYFTRVNHAKDELNGEVKIRGQSLMVDIAKHGRSAQFNYFGGGNVSAHEVAEAVQNGMPAYVRDMSDAKGRLGAVHDYVRRFPESLFGDWYRFSPDRRRDQTYGFDPEDKVEAENALDTVLTKPNRLWRKATLAVSELGFVKKYDQWQGRNAFEKGVMPILPMAIAAGIFLTAHAAPAAIILAGCVAMVSVGQMILKWLAPNIKDRRIRKVVKGAGHMITAVASAGAAWYSLVPAMPLLSSGKLLSSGLADLYGAATAVSTAAMNTVFGMSDAAKAYGFAGDALTPTKRKAELALS
ncbi:MAG: hypothetical protein JO126_01070 [Alphaproteobacteria bacterium]|nr:hypothetical protein [Alphaproteobacteria bacterium]